MVLVLTGKRTPLQGRCTVFCAQPTACQAVTFSVAGTNTPTTSEIYLDQQWVASQIALTNYWQMVKCPPAIVVSSYALIDKPPEKHQCKATEGLSMREDEMGTS